MPGCHHCVDRPEDTLEVCSAWVEHCRRHVLLETIGRGDLSRTVQVEAMVRGGVEAWEAATSFCEAIMLAKEEAVCEWEMHQSSVLQSRRHPSPSGRLRGRPKGHSRRRVVATNLRPP